MNRPLQIGLLLFPDVTQLDLTGPWEVFARTPGVECHLIWKDLQPVRSDRGLSILPTTTFADCPPLDVICVPGGPGQIALMSDDITLNFLRQQADQAKWVTSVCTGSLVLGAAGLLKGYRATSHWSSIDQLALLGAEPVSQRVVRDRNRISGAGVTSGIDFALTLVAEIAGDAVAKSVQLQMEYDPEPPFTSGSPHTASPQEVEQARAKMAEFLATRRAATERAALRLQAD
ncbi:MULTISPECIES: DJ-1/PfpI family protein [Pantoea]|jgi:cyclohexyl-isocyanide hydratase|uniref:DJ-1/PfpI family protein n=1 Tax=Pantoea TaxID=53335 RepID=UPI00044BB95E|nr:MULTISPECIES: DJ-1/PfpI family protein [Pantoea]EZI33303.1 putative amidotransferase of ThiH/PfpI family protein [Pantoea agglomerans]KAF6682689.1 DJ-1/PfpI family protein [Pantoea sp. EKM20T]KDA93763.1 dimethylglycine dehydrogenase [Pantoea agglomerans Eh318]KNH35174.1 thiamine biosynthesis protein ThiJ [Pantoea vagans]MCX2905626.1 DJ-1/PfpI family protein [[Curtobacterium] plantarum]